MGNINDFIAHYGISGQKWGVRNYQNADGTLTEAGKERYYDHTKKHDRKERREEKRRAKEEAKPESARWKSSEARYLSDAELNRRNNRLSKEEQYRRMTESKGHRMRRNVKNFITKHADAILVGTAVGVGKKMMGQYYNKVIPSLVNSEATKNAVSSLVKGLSKIKIPLK